jgi:ABC-type sugar transport system permease subunit
MTTTKIISGQPEDRAVGATTWEYFTRWATPYVLISPFFIIFFIFQLLPIAFSIFLSFADWNGMSAIKFTGLENFITMFQDAKFWNSLRVSLIITVVCILVGTAGSMLLAILLEKVEDRLAGILRVIFFLPSVTSVVVITYIWKQMYSTDYGYFNALLTKIGLPPQDWLSDPKLAMPALLIMLIWAGLGWDALIITSGLRAIPDELYDSGKVDGTNDWTEFRHITLPLLRPTLLFILVTSVIYLWGLFAQPNLLTGGGPLRVTQPVAMYLYQQAFTYHKFGYASAIAVVLSIIMFISSYLNFRFVQYEAE